MATLKEVDFNFWPYPEQQNVINAMEEGYKRFFIVWTRRAGKDRVSFNILIEEAMKRVGTYLYAFTNVPQAKLAMWNTIDMEGKSPIDYIPKELVYEVNKSDMSITLRNPDDLRKPGSIIKVTGTHDGARKLRGGNYMGAVLSEYAFMAPDVYTIITASLLRTNGWCILNTTVNGHNHAYKLWESSKNSKSWYHSYHTCETYLDCDGNRLISKESIDQELESGAISQAKINQEFYCDWDAAIEGAVFSNELEKAMQQGRVKDFQLSNTPVSMFMDIGINAKTGCTSIWFVQFQKDGSVHFVDYMEDSDQPAVYYVNKIKQWMHDNDMTFGKCYLPHDSMQRDKIECNTYAKRYIELGMDVQVIPRIERKSYAIEFSRTSFRKYSFNTTRCDRGIQALREYNWETMGKTHWANHACDAFLAVGQYLNLEKPKRENTFQQIQYGVPGASAFG